MFQFVKDMYETTVSGFMKAINECVSAVIDVPHKEKVVSVTNVSTSANTTPGSTASASTASTVITVAPRASTLQTTKIAAVPKPPPIDVIDVYIPLSDIVERGIKLLSTAAPSSILKTPGKKYLKNRQVTINARAQERTPELDEFMQVKYRDAIVSTIVPFYEWFAYINCPFSSKGRIKMDLVKVVRSEDRFLNNPSNDKCSINSALDYTDCLGIGSSLDASTIAKPDLFNGSPEAVIEHGKNGLSIQSTSSCLETIYQGNFKRTKINRFDVCIVPDNAKETAIIDSGSGKYTKDDKFVEKSTGKNKMENLSDTEKLSLANEGNGFQKCIINSNGSSNENFIKCSCKNQHENKCPISNKESNNDSLESSSGNNKLFSEPADDQNRMRTLVSSSKFLQDTESITSVVIKESILSQNNNSVNNTSPSNETTGNNVQHSIEIWPSITENIEINGSKENSMRQKSSTVISESSNIIIPMYENRKCSLGWVPLPSENVRCDSTKRNYSKHVGGASLFKRILQENDATKVGPTSLFQRILEESDTTNYSYSED